MACFTDSILLKWEDRPVNVISVEQHPDSISLCTSFTVAGQLISTDQGSIYPQTVSLNNLTGYTVISGQLSFSQSATFINLPPASAPVWNIAPLIDSAGWFSNDLLHLGESITVVFTLQKECDMQLQAGDTLELPQVGFTYTGYCSDSVYYQLARTVPLQPMAYKAVYTGISNCTNCFSLAKLASADTVATGDILTYSIIICVNNSSQNTVTLHELLPNGFVMTSANTSQTVALPAQGCDTVLISGYFTLPGAILKYYNDSTVYNDKATSAQQGYNRESAFEKITKALALIKPNPAKETITLIHQLDVKAGTKFIITDALSRVLFTSVLPEGKQEAEFNLSVLANGLNFFRIVNDKESLFHGKFVISK